MVKKSAIELLIVGPSSQNAGGIPQYIAEQRERLSDRFDVDVYDINAERAGLIPDSIRAILSSLQDWLSFPLQSRPDIVHVHISAGLLFYRAAFYVLFASYIWRKPVVLHVHSPQFDEFLATKSHIVRFIQSIVFENSDRIIVLSDYWKQVLDPHTTQEKLEILPNAVEPAQYTPQYRTDNPILSFVSTHKERKGIVELTEALQKLEERDLDFNAYIAGDGPLSDSVRSLASKSDNVEFLGFISESKKQQLLSDSTIFVLPSYAEGLPIALLEGMAGGNAIVTSNVGSIPDVVREENGRLIPPGDEDALMNALESLIIHPDVAEAMGRKNRQLIMDNYSWSNVASELEDLYDELIISSSD